MASTDKIEAFLAEPRNVVLAGIRRDGRPHLSPNWFYWDGQRFYVSTTRARVKYAIFRRDGRAQLLVDDPSASVPCLSRPPSRSVRISPLSCPDSAPSGKSMDWLYRTTMSIFGHCWPTGGSCWPLRLTGRFQAGRAGAWTNCPAPMVTGPGA